MACSSCSPQSVPLVRAGLPTVWAWLPPDTNLVPVPPEQALAILDQTNGPLN